MLRSAEEHHGMGMMNFVLLYSPLYTKVKLGDHSKAGLSDTLSPVISLPNKWPVLLLQFCDYGAPQTNLLFM
jgi:hypothetical protein